MALISRVDGSLWKRERVSLSLLIFLIKKHLYFKCCLKLLSKMTSSSCCVCQIIDKFDCGDDVVGVCMPDIITVNDPKVDDLLDDETQPGESDGAQAGAPSMKAKSK